MLTIRLETAVWNYRNFSLSVLHSSSDRDRHWLGQQLIRFSNFANNYSLSSGLSSHLRYSRKSDLSWTAGRDFLWEPPPSSGPAGSGRTSQGPPLRPREPRVHWSSQTLKRSRSLIISTIEAAGSDSKYWPAAQLKIHSKFSYYNWNIYLYKCSK